MGEPSVGDLIQGLGGGAVALFAYVVWRSIDKLTDVVRTGFESIRDELHDQGERLARLEKANEICDDDRERSRTGTRTPPRGVVPFRGPGDDR